MSFTDAQSLRKRLLLKALEVSSDAEQALCTAARMEDFILGTGEDAAQVEADKADESDGRNAERNGAQPSTHGEGEDDGAGESSWTRDQEHLLASLWADSQSMEQIAAQLGRTTMFVADQARRLGLDDATIGSADPMATHPAGVDATHGALPNDGNSDPSDSHAACDPDPLCASSSDDSGPTPSAQPTSSTSPSQRTADPAARAIDFASPVTGADCRNGQRSEGAPASSVNGSHARPSYSNGTHACGPILGGAGEISGQAAIEPTNGLAAHKEPENLGAEEAGVSFRIAVPVTLDAVIGFLRAQDFTVIKAEDGRFRMDGNDSLTVQELLDKANDLRSYLGKHQFVLK